MKNRTTYLFVLLIFAGLWNSCEDIIEEDLGNNLVTILSPSDSLHSEISSITFWWEKLEGAEGYNLQIAKPSFLNVSQLCLDTNITSDKFIFSLIPGQYQWRIKAYNGSSCTEYVTYNLSIDSTADLSGQTIILLSPTDKDTTNKTTFTFKWDTLYNADDYRIDICTPDFSGTKVLSIVTESDTFKYPLQEGRYEWGVRGQNSLTNTPFSKRSLYIDITVPNIPSLLTPANNTNMNDSIINFSWSRGVVTGSTIKDSLYIYFDSTMTTIKRAKYLSLTNYTDSLGVGTFFWRVRSIDAAENYSNYSALRKLTLH
jgi:hypothetical protein